LSVKNSLSLSLTSQAHALAQTFFTSDSLLRV